MFAEILKLMMETKERTSENVQRKERDNIRAELTWLRNCRRQNEHEIKRRGPRRDRGREER